MYFFFFFRQSIANRISKTGRSCLRTNIYRSNATWEVHLHNYLLAESPRRPFVRRFTAACALASFFFFLVLFPNCFLRLPSPPFFHAVFRLSSSSVFLSPFDWLFYRHPLFLHVPPIRLRLPLFPLWHRLCRLKIPSGSELQQASTSNASDWFMWAKDGVSATREKNWLYWHDVLRKIFNIAKYIGRPDYISCTVDSRKKWHRNVAYNLITFYNITFDSNIV